MNCYLSSQTSLDDRLKLEVENTTSVLEQVSKKLDKNLNLQFIFSFIALLFVFNPEIFAEKIVISPLDIKIPATYLKIFLPVILLKFFMDWCTHSYEYIYVRRHVGKLLKELAMEDRWEYFVPPSAYKYIYHTEFGGDNWVLIVAHVVLSIVVLTVVSFNIGLVSFYGCSLFGVFWLKLSIWVVVVIFVLSCYLANYIALRDIMNVWWYKLYLSILAFESVIAFSIAACHCL